ncbi:chorismate-binding protein [Abyssalbus ytuae]|uniref:Chorismate-binding protein n=1 Tax=Abyssalbus ytuae TaxID=2926907 RepID=A0A9E7D311_9FLAO|nr:chorismate-binding protein [Abyssalbus ytuae]UOB17304.1 chorismate-binding protein [Abyssalbus ytuae]
MISLEDFFDRIQYQIKNKLPYTIYKKADENVLHSILQNDNKLYRVKNYSESGFIFSLFDNERINPIIIPLSNAKPFSTFFIPSEAYDKSAMIINEPFHFPLRKVDYMELLNKALNEIKTGDMQKVVVSRTEKVDLKEDSIITIFKKLANTYTGAFVYLWYHPKVGTWMGATPETLFKINDSEFNTMALAGTQPFQGSMEVEWGEKEIMEQQLVVDDIVNKLNSEEFNLQISSRYTVRAGNILHLRTDIKGTLPDSNLNIGELVNSLHPTPAVCGLPAEEAKKFILKNEGYNRKYYTGYLGELNIPDFKIKNEDDLLLDEIENEELDESTNKKSDLYVNLRCMEIVGHKAVLYVGGGITKDSDAEKEWEETVNKTKVMKKVLF